MNTPLLQELFAKDPERAAAPARAHPGGPVRRARGARGRRRVPRERRRVVHHRLDVPRRRRHQLRVRHAALGSSMRIRRATRRRRPGCRLRHARATPRRARPRSLSAGLLLTPARPATRSRRPCSGCCSRSGSASIGPGRALPPERELAAMLEVSRDTLREAIASLAEAGWVVARRGRYGGTFVTDELPTRRADRRPAPIATRWRPAAARGHARAPRGHRGRAPPGGPRRAS